MITMDANNVDFVALEELFAFTPTDIDVQAALDEVCVNYEIIARINDKYGWDNIILLPDGRVFFRGQEHRRTSHY